MPTTRKLVLDLELCIGCTACANACPPGLISLDDGDSARRISFPSVCPETCNLCAHACSENALSLTNTDLKTKSRFDAAFQLAKCPNCSAPVATEKMTEKIRTILSNRLGEDSTEWVNFCLACRGNKEADRMRGGSLAKEEGTKTSEV